MRQPPFGGVVGVTGEAARALEPAVRGCPRCLALWHAGASDLDPPLCDCCARRDVAAAFDALRSWLLWHARALDLDHPLCDRCARRDDAAAFDALRSWLRTFGPDKREAA